MDWAVIPLRLVVAIVFIVHGYGKLSGAGVGPGMEGFIQMLTGLGVPLPSFAAWVVALVEFVGGIGIFLGLFTRVWAGLLAINMVVAYALVKTKMPFPAGEIDLAMFAINLSLIGMGAGCISLDALMHRKKREPQPLQQ